MPTPDASEHAKGSRDLHRLFVLRSLVVGFELAALLGASLLTELRLPIAWLIALIGTLLLTNIWTWRHIARARPVGEAEFFLLLSIDVLALTGVLYLTGGAGNPFAWFLLLPLIIAATVLSPAATWLMAALTTACYSGLMVDFQPLSTSGSPHHDAQFSQHVFGMWFGFVWSAALIAWPVVGMAKTLRERERLLTEAREQALRDKQLVALGTLATGAAHELGTPLATMAVVVGELERQAHLSARDRGRLRLLRDQIGRCKQALATLSATAGETRAEAGGLVTVESFLDQLVQQWRAQRPGVELNTDFRPASGNAVMIGERTLQQSLVNLLNNAADASTTDLRLNAGWDNQSLRLEILDRGPGLQPQSQPVPGERQASGKEYGMGLGLFLTHATLKRLGGDITLSARAGGGTRTCVTLPLADREAA